MIAAVLIKYNATLFAVDGGNVLINNNTATLVAMRVNIKVAMRVNTYLTYCDLSRSTCSATLDCSCWPSLSITTLRPWSQLTMYTATKVSDYIMYKKN